MNDNDRPTYVVADLTRSVRGHEINSFNREHVAIFANAPDGGGASHVYSIGVAANAEAYRNAGWIEFQNGPIQEVGFNGVTDEALLAIVLDRLRGFQRGALSCRENAIVITKLEESLMWLRARAEDRERRGVEGTSQK